MLETEVSGTGPAGSLRPGRQRRCHLQAPRFTKVPRFRTARVPEGPVSTGQPGGHAGPQAGVILIALCFSGRRPGGRAPKLRRQLGPRCLWPAGQSLGSDPTVSQQA